MSDGKKENVENRGDGAPCGRNLVPSTATTRIIRVHIIRSVFTYDVRAGGESFSGKLYAAEILLLLLKFRGCEHDVNGRCSRAGAADRLRLQARVQRIRRDRRDERERWRVKVVLMQEVLGETSGGGYTCIRGRVRATAICFLAPATETTTTIMNMLRRVGRNKSILIVFPGFLPRRIIYTRTIYYIVYCAICSACFLINRSFSPFATSPTRSTPRVIGQPSFVAYYVSPLF